MISIITPSLGHVGRLRNLCASLAQQKPVPYELLLCTTGASKNLPAQLPSTLIKIRYFDSPENCISQARNRGLRNASGDLILFLDEDCHLPHDSYLQDLYQAYLENPNLCGGGFYLSEKRKTNFTSRFYNYFCNFWLNLHLDEERSARVLLGGCSFYAKQILREHNIEFSALFRKSGEEYGFNKAILEHGYLLSLRQRWSVYHNPNCNLRGLLKKAWIQGLSLEEKQLKPLGRSRHFLHFFARNPIESFKALPLLALYYSVGRVAHLTRRWQRN